jgi:hypothetical protein
MATSATVASNVSASSAATNGSPLNKTRVDSPIGADQEGYRARVAVFSRAAKAYIENKNKFKGERAFTELLQDMIDHLGTLRGYDFSHTRAWTTVGAPMAIVLALNSHLQSCDSSSSDSMHMSVIRFVCFSKFYFDSAISIA